MSVFKQDIICCVLKIIYLKFVQPVLKVHVEKVCDQIDDVGREHDDEAGQHCVHHHIPRPEVVDEGGLHRLKDLVGVHLGWMIYTVTRKLKSLWSVYLQILLMCKMLLLLVIRFDYCPEWMYTVYKWWVLGMFLHCTMFTTELPNHLFSIMRFLYNFRKGVKFVQYFIIYL